MGSDTSLDYCELTDIGRRRASNQDSKAVLTPLSGEQYRRRGWLFVVADGMGAHAAGELASAMAVEHVPLVYEKLAARSPPRALDASIRQAHAVIHERGENAADLKGMGTTCTALALVPRGAIVGHVGDSRAYRIRGGSIDQLSRDHSLSWELAGQRTPGVDEPVPKNIITRSVGPQLRIDVDVEGPFAVQAGDVFVLCTDGLSGQVADAEIGLIAGGLPPDAAAAALVGLTLVRGAPDNVTVIVVRAGEKEESHTSPGDPPWPLTDETATPTPQPIPVRLLAGAAAGLLMALVFNPWSGLMAKDGGVGGLLGDLAFPLACVISITMVVLFISCLLSAVLSFFPTSTGPVRVLPVGARLGSGPYRTYDCTPSADLVEGIVASVETAADGLSPREREKLLVAVAGARSRITANDLSAALRGAADALAVYRRSIEAARGDDTARG